MSPDYARSQKPQVQSHVFFLPGLVRALHVKQLILSISKIYVGNLLHFLQQQQQQQEEQEEDCSCFIQNR